MGRFRAVIEDDEEDNDDVVDCDGERDKKQWEFVSTDPNETGALCLRESEDTTMPTDPVSPMRSVFLSSNESQQTKTNAILEWFLEQQRYRDVALRYEWEQQQQHQQRTRCSCSGGVRLFVLTLSVVLVAMWWDDPPPAPPPPMNSLFDSSIPAGASTATGDAPLTEAHLMTWSHYLTVHSQQFMEATTALGIAMPKHILYWLGNSMVTDLILKYENMRLWSFERVVRWIRRRPPASSSSCSWNPQSLDTDWNFDELIVGQSLAVEWLSDTVKAWGSLFSSTTGTTMSPTASALAGLQRPLIVLATGHAHTGKRTLAYALMNQLYYGRSSCPHRGSVDDAMILHLHGADWTLDAHRIDHHTPSAATVTRTHLLFQKLSVTIESHILRVRRASDASSSPSSSTLLIMLTDIDAMDVDVLSRLLVAMSVPLTTSHRDPAILIQPDLFTLCRHSILFLTSDSLGVKAITRSLRTGRGDLHSVMASLSADLNDAVAQHFVSASASQYASSNPQKWISSILPFVPLTDQTLPSLLRRRVSQLCPSLGSGSSSSEGYDPTCPCHVMVTDAAIRHVLHESRVEYIEWNFSPQPRPVSTTESLSADSTTSFDDALPLQIKMVLDGADVLSDQSPIMTKLGAQIRPLLPPLCQIDQTTTRQHPKILVLDYDVRSLLESKRGLLQWCDAEGEGEALQGCHEVQRFRM